MEPKIKEIFDNPSSLPRTWFLDLDGTLLKHNGSLEYQDELLPGVVEFFKKISPYDVIVITSARSGFHKKQSLDFLIQNGLRYDYAIFDLPVGERIVLNDEKPRGLQTAIGITVKRDRGLL